MKKILTLCMLIVTSFAINAQKFEVGDKIWAWEKSDTYWYQATILSKVDVLNYMIHWEGFDSKYDQSISVHNLWKEGLEYQVSDKLQGMETDGKWYNVKVLKRDLANKKYFINWGGFDSKYDRWISYDSLRLPTKANAIEDGKFSYVAPSTGSGGSSVTLKNKCAGKAYFYIPPVTGMGTYKHEALNGGASKTLSLSNGEEVWLSNEKRDKISLLFKAGSSSGSEVILCK